MRLPSSFLPDEDQGYAFVNMQLPNAASLERTSAVAAQVEQILAKTPGVQYTTSVIGFSLLSYVQHQLQRLLFCHPQALGRAQIPSRAISSHQGALESGNLSQLPWGLCVQLFAAGHPRRGHFRRFHVYA